MKWEASYNVRAMRGLARSVGTIDDSHLGITNSMMHYCFTELVNVEPLVLDLHQDTDNTTRFPDADTSDQTVPIPLGLDSNTSSPFVLTFPTTTATAPTLTFTGSFISDSGIPLVIDDRFRSEYQLQPDGKLFTWNGVGAA